MSKKIFTILFLAVFMLAQFSIATAAPAAVVTGSLTDTPIFSNSFDGVKLNWSVTGLDAASNLDDYVLIWSREAGGDGIWDFCQPAGSVASLTSANGTLIYDLTYIYKLNYTGPFSYYDQDMVEFRVSTDQYQCAPPPPNPAVGPFSAPVIPPSPDLPAQGSTFIDDFAPEGFLADPPYSAADGIYPIGNQHVACNTFEMWALASDNVSYYAGPVIANGYSGFDSWNQSITGTFVPPAPIGPENALLSWPYTFPSTASGEWSFMIEPEDAAGNYSFLFGQFRYELEIEPDELLDCETFSDVSGHDYELYIRYLATLGLISGYGDGTFGPDGTLTRAEAATLFEISNGFDDTILPESAPAGCEFSDVSVSDWFAGWVWQACKDGFMNGLGGGLFGSNDLLTRGQIVTIMNNIANLTFNLKSEPIPLPAPLFGGYLATCNVITCPWGVPFREAAWTDVNIGDYFAQPVINAYGVGVVEGTDATHFSPNQPTTRGEFAKMLYRGLSVAAPIIGNNCCYIKGVSPSAPCPTICIP